MDELRSLVEKCRVVFIRFDHEELRIRASRRRAEIDRHAADQERWIESRLFEDPREHRCCRRLAMRAGDREHPPIVQYVFTEPLRTRTVRTAGIEDRFHQRIAARYDIADDEDVRVACYALQLLRAE